MLTTKRRRRTARLLPLIALVIAFITAGPAAWADFGTFPDPKDARTRLDIAETSLRFHPNTHRYKWRFATYERFRLRNGGTFVLFVDSVGAGRWDYGVYVWYDGGHGLACDRNIRPGAGGLDHFLPGPFDINPRSGWCAFRGIRRNKMPRWRVETVRHQGKPFGNPLDRAPDGDWF
jgi:hypothetical protein